MNAEGSRDPERNWHGFSIPPGMKDREALEFFMKHRKPKSFRLLKYKYYPKEGRFLALEESCR